MEKIENAKITKVSLHYYNDAILTFDITLEGNGWGTVYGGYALGNKINGECSSKGLCALMKILDVVDVDSWEDLKGKYVRVKIDSISGPINEIGNLIEDKWFNITDYFRIGEK